MTILIILSLLLLAIVFGVIAMFYFMQERMIFQPVSLPEHFSFEFSTAFNEGFLPVSNSVSLNTLHFTTDNPKGVILYFHGNAGSLASWGHWASDFTALGYDVFMYDYRGYGKSGGKIRSERVLYRDAETVFEHILKTYDKEDIIPYGVSLGTGIASWLASQKNLRQLVLVTPYNNFLDLVRHHYPWLPSSVILKYRFPTDKNLQSFDNPIHIFHGTNDELVPYESSLRLLEAVPKAHLITIEKGEHNNLPESDEFKRLIPLILEKQTTE